MVGLTLGKDAVFGLVHPFVDAHTLGVSSVAQLLEDCGYTVHVAGEEVCRAVQNPRPIQHIEQIRGWIRTHRITELGFSYRLDPRDGAEAFDLLLHQLWSAKLLIETGGPIRSLLFAGLPEACDRVLRKHRKRVLAFRGDETPLETLDRLGIPPGRRPTTLAEESAYDAFRMGFGRELVASGKADAEKPTGSDYSERGTRKDGLVKRLDATADEQLPLMRAHVGPYGPNRLQAVEEFLGWCQRLALSGHLDVLSIGTSQLTQERFGEEWGDAPNGGGVPIQNEAEHERVYEASRPMLVRTYAGTRDVPRLAEIHERTLNIAWHALSFWWFCQTDGRGPNPVLTNLREHLETLRFIARTGKPFEPNIPHHFAFRGGDDVTYVVSAILAARAAKRAGVPVLVLQAMLNTPRATWGIQDLAKARAMLTLARELEDESFRIVLQPRAGLDFFSPDLDKARAQLASVSALMDDIEPENPRSPEVVHVVSYSEASHLADPPVIDESVRLTRAALKAYRKRKARNGSPLDGMGDKLKARTEGLLQESRAALEAFESAVPNPYSAEGLYRAFASGFLLAPYLWERREEFAPALRWKTKLHRGGIVAVGPDGAPLPIELRLEAAAEHARIAAHQDSLVNDRIAFAR